MACGGNMRLVRIAPDHRTDVPGFKTHTLKCSGCRETEERRVFDRPSKKFEPFHDAPPIAVEEGAHLKEGEALLREAMEKVSGPNHSKARNAWMRTAAKLRGKADEES
jgi:hypothetical protein